MGAQPKLPGMQAGYDRGYGHERTQHNALEKAFADAWEKENLPLPGINHGNGILQDLFFDPKGRAVHEITDPERMVAATVVQWLGTNVGFSFLTEILRSQRFHVLPEDMLPPNLSGFASSVADALVDFFVKTRKADLAAETNLSDLIPAEELIENLARCLGANQQRTLDKVRQLLEDPPMDPGDFYSGMLALIEAEKSQRANPVNAIKERLLDELRKRPSNAPTTLDADVFDDIEPPF